MTNLECDVTTCAYNCDNLCCRSSILVDGRRASKRAQTCCDSFEQRSFSLNSDVRFDAPTESTEIACKAHECTFNCHGECEAKHVSVCTCGCSDPCSCEETECASFRKEE